MPRRILVEYLRISQGMSSELVFIIVQVLPRIAARFDHHDIGSFRYSQALPF